MCNRTSDGNLIILNQTANSHVSISIHRRQKKATHPTQIPGIIVDKTSSSYPLYKVETEKGIIKTKVAASQLMPYPVTPEILKENNKITLRGAGRRGCLYKNCSCRKKNVKCAQHCHQGCGCSNQLIEETLSFPVPKAGGMSEVDGQSFSKCSCEKVC